MSLVEEIPTSDNDKWEKEDLSTLLFSFLFFLKRHINKISLIVGLFIALSVVYALAQKRTWMGQFQIVLSQNNDMDQNSLISFINPGRKSDLKTEVLILKSPSVLMPIFEFVKQEKILENKKFNSWKFNDWSKKSLFIGLDKGTSVLNLSYQDTNKQLILPVLDRISSAYQLYAGKDNKEISIKTLKYLNNQISTYKKNTFESLNKLQNYGLENNISIADYDTTEGQEYLTNVEELRIETVQKLFEVKRQLNDLKEIESPEKFFFYASQISYLENIQSANDYLEKIDLEILKLKEIYTEKNTILLSKINERSSFIGFLKSQILKELAARIKSLESIIQSTERQEGVIENYKKYLVDYKLNNQTLKDLTIQYTRLKIEAQKDPNPWKLITNPTLLDSPVGLSKKRIVIFATLAGSFFALLIAYLSDITKNIIYDDKTMNRLTNSKKLFDFKVEDSEIYSTIKYLSNGILNLPKGSKVSLIVNSKIKPENLNKIKDIFITSLKDLEIVVSDDILNVEGAKKILILTSVGIEKKDDVNKIMKNLNLMNRNIDGWINYINNNTKN